MNIMKKQGRRSAEDAEKTKHQILDIATQLFCERGFARVSLRTISEQAGISHSLIRHHFGSKEQIWSDINEQLKNQIEMFFIKLIKSLPTDLPPNQKLYQFTVHALAYNLLDPRPIKLAADMMQQQADVFVTLLNEPNRLEAEVNKLVLDYNVFYPDTPITNQELKWHIIVFAHSAATFRPFLDSIWPAATVPVRLLNHWQTFNILMAARFQIPANQQMQPVTLTDLLQL